MKKLSAILLGICTVAFMLTSCEGPMGPAGANGADGANGKDANETCKKCHNSGSELVAKELQWSTSVHASGAHIDRNAYNCAICHTNEGFIERVATGKDSVSVPINPTPISCRTCHKIHTDYDSTDWALRYTDPVQLMINSQKTIDLGDGNLCAKCHQPRLPSPMPVLGGDSVKITNTHWGPHHGPQSALLKGTGGYEFPGSVAYTNSKHSTQIANGCITCHMADPVYADEEGPTAGGHTYKVADDNGKINTNGCLSCHSNATDLNNTITAKQTEIEGLLSQLETKLTNAGLLSNGAPVAKKMSANQAGAVLNFLLVEEDRSGGVHNYNYTKALLQNSIDASL